MSKLFGFEACKTELRRLLAEVETNINKVRLDPVKYPQAVVTETWKLVDFIGRTEPLDGATAAEADSIDEIDQLAEDARKSIHNAAANDIINQIQAAASQLNQLSMQVQRQAAENTQKAETLRLTSFRSFVDSLTNAVNAFNAAKNALQGKDTTDAAVKTKIDSVVAAINELQKAAQNI